MTNKVITRFAPSPTGYLHIGGVRTAFFNWLFSKHYKGKMLLRIEDTDRTRSTEDAIDKILDGLSWMGLDHDDEIIYQHDNINRHKEIANKLLTGGHAYKCYCSKKELEQVREQAIIEGKSPKYNGKCRNIDETKKLADNNSIEPVIRFKSPQDIKIVIDDLVQGRVVFESDKLDDLIILRSDGTPTYMLSVVVDDHDMNVSHIIRGDDHLTNAARQVVIYEALGWQRPTFAHIPLIHGQDGTKLSKRHSALGVEEYRKMGFIAEALRNYLIRLGWSHGDDEFFTTEQMINWFDVKDVNKGAARFDVSKLVHINSLHLKSLSINELYKTYTTHIKYLANANKLEKMMAKINKANMLYILNSAKERFKTLEDIAQYVEFLDCTKDISPDKKAYKLIDDVAIERLGRFINYLNKFDDDSWNVLNVENWVRNFSKDEGVGLGKVAQPLRTCLTGSTLSTSIFDVIFILGKAEVIKRIEKQIN